MLAPDDYQAMAQECFRRVREAKTDNERQDYLDLVRTRLEAASHLDCSALFLCRHLAIGGTEIRVTF